MSFNPLNNIEASFSSSNSSNISNSSQDHLLPPPPLLSPIENRAMIINNLWNKESQILAQISSERENANTILNTIQALSTPSSSQHSTIPTAIELIFNLPKPLNSSNPNPTTVTPLTQKDHLITQITQRIEVGEQQYNQEINKINTEIKNEIQQLINQLKQLQHPITTENGPQILQNLINESVKLKKYESLKVLLSNTQLILSSQEYPQTHYKIHSQPISYEYLEQLINNIVNSLDGSESDLENLKILKILISNGVELRKEVLSKILTSSHIKNIDYIVDHININNNTFSLFGKTLNTELIQELTGIPKKLYELMAPSRGSHNGLIPILVKLHQKNLFNIKSQKKLSKTKINLIIDLYINDSNIQSYSSFIYQLLKNKLVDNKAPCKCLHNLLPLAVNSNNQDLFTSLILNKFQYKDFNPLDILHAKPIVNRTHNIAFFEQLISASTSLPNKDTFLNKIYITIPVTNLFFQQTSNFPLYTLTLTLSQLLILGSDETFINSHLKEYLFNALNINSNFLEKINLDLLRQNDEPTITRFTNRISFFIKALVTEKNLAITEYNNKCNQAELASLQQLELTKQQLHLTFPNDENTYKQHFDPQHQFIKESLQKTKRTLIENRDNALFNLSNKIISLALLLKDEAHIKEIIHSLKEFLFENNNKFTIPTHHLNPNPNIYPNKAFFSAFWQEAIQYLKIQNKPPKNIDISSHNPLKRKNLSDNNLNSLDSHPHTPFKRSKQEKKSPKRYSETDQLSENSPMEQENENFEEVISKQEAEKLINLKFIINLNQNSQSNNNLTTTLELSLPSLMTVSGNKEYLDQFIQKHPKMLDVIIPEILHANLYYLNFTSHLLLNNKNLPIDCLNSPNIKKCINQYTTLFIKHLISLGKKGPGQFYYNENLKQLNSLTNLGINIQELLKNTELRQLLYSIVQNYQYFLTPNNYSSNFLHVTLANQDLDLSIKLLEKFDINYLSQYYFPIPLNIYPIPQAQPSVISGLGLYKYFYQKLYIHNQNNPQQQIHNPQFYLLDKNNNTVIIPLLTYAILYKDKEAIQYLLQLSIHKESYFQSLLETTTPSLLTQYNITINNLIELGVDQSLLLQNKSLLIKYIYEKESLAVERLNELLTLGVDIKTIFDHADSTHMENFLFNEEKDSNENIHIHVFIKYIFSKKEQAKERLEKIIDSGISPQKLYDLAVSEHYKALTYDDIYPLLRTFSEKGVKLYKEKTNSLPLFSMSNSPRQKINSIEIPQLETSLKELLNYNIPIDTLSTHLISLEATPKTFINLIPLLKKLGFTTEKNNKTPFPIFLDPFLEKKQNSNNLFFNTDKFIEFSPQLIKYNFLFYASDINVTAKIFNKMFLSNSHLLQEVSCIQQKIQETYIKKIIHVLDIWNKKMSKETLFSFSFFLLNKLQNHINATSPNSGSSPLNNPENFKELITIYNYIKQGSKDLENPNPTDELEDNTTNFFHSTASQLNQTKQNLLPTELQLLYKVDTSYLVNFSFSNKTDKEKEVAARNFVNEKDKFLQLVPTYQDLNITQEERNKRIEDTLLILNAANDKKAEVPGTMTDSPQFHQFYNDFQSLLNLVLFQAYNKDEQTLNPEKTLEVLKLFSNNTGICITGKYGQFMQDLRLLKGVGELSLNNSIIQEINRQLELMRIEVLKETIREQGQEIHFFNAICQNNYYRSTLGISFEGSGEQIDPLALQAPETQQRINDVINSTLTKYQKMNFEIIDLITSNIKNAMPHQPLHYKKIAKWMTKNLIKEWEKEKFDKLVKNEKMWNEIKYIADSPENDKKSKIFSTLQTCLIFEGFPLIKDQGKRRTRLKLKIQELLNNNQMNDLSNSSLYKEVISLVEKCRQKDFLQKEIYNQEIHNGKFQIRLDRILELLDYFKILTKHECSNLLTHKEFMILDNDTKELLKEGDEAIDSFLKAITSFITY